MSGASKGISSNSGGEKADSAKMILPGLGIDPANPLVSYIMRPFSMTYPTRASNTPH